MSDEERPQQEASAGRARQLRGLYRAYFLGATLLSVALSIFFVFKIPIFGYVMPEQSYFSVLLGVFVSSAFLLFPRSLKSPKDRVPYYDAILAGLSLLGPIYVYVFALDIMSEGWEVDPSATAQVLGLLTWVLIIEAVRRTGGAMLACTIILISVYPLFGHLCPGILMSKNLSLERVIGFHYLSTESMFGLPTRVFSRLVMGYMIFAAVMMSTGAADFFFKFCLALLGGVRGGGAKVSILSSAFFATMSGSAIANVVTTGSFTIPTMKRLGYPPHYAAAIEACASKGGTLSPPVMGITAFIMADFLGVSYAEVCIAAALPILLYWVSLFVQTDLYAAKTGLRGMPKEELPGLWQTFKDGWYYLISLVVLIYFIFVLRVVAWAPFIAAATLLVLVNIRKASRLQWRSLFDLTAGTGKILAELMAIMAGVGMIIGALSLTGTAHGLTGWLTQLGGENMLMLLVLGAITSFVLGIGLTISACYIFLAMLLAPTLVNVGINEMAAHLFLVYWGSVSFITPPVALAAYAAASIAGADPLKTGFHSVKLGFVSLLVPFFFVYNPALVAQGTFWQIINAFLTAGAGIVLLSTMFEGYGFVIQRVSVAVRALFGAAGLLMFHPRLASDLIGLGLALAAIALHWVQDRARPAAGGGGAGLSMEKTL